jgi:hypothetical protein
LMVEVPRCGRPKAPSTKLQAPEKHQTPNTKHQTAIDVRE